MHVSKIVFWAAELMAVTLLAILLERFLNTKIAVIAFILCLGLVGWHHCTEITSAYLELVVLYRKNPVKSVLALSVFVAVLVAATWLLISSIESERPHVQTALVIDSVTEDGVTYHYHLKNISPKLSVNNIRLGSRSQRFSWKQNDQFTDRHMPPGGGELDIPGWPAVFRPHECSLFTTILHYDSEKKPFTSIYQFAVNPDQPRPIYPTNWQEQDGNIETSDLTFEKVVSFFESDSPNGTIHLALNEIPNEQPKLGILVSDRKLFVFNPIKRLVYFMVRKTSGEISDLQLPLRDSQEHDIVVAWDYQKGVTLEVDGVVKSNME